MQPGHGAFPPLVEPAGGDKIWSRGFLINLIRRANIVVFLSLYLFYLAWLGVHVSIRSPVNQDYQDLVSGGQWLAHCGPPRN